MSKIKSSSHRLHNKTPSPNSHALKHPKNKRADAAWVLYQVLENGRSCSDLMPTIWQRHEAPQTRAWLQEMVYGSLRNLPKLQVWLRHLLDKPLKKEQKIVEHLLMLGLYQLAFTRTAKHAAVSETVESCKVMKHPALSGLVNAVLRRFQREETDKQAFEQDHVKLNLPKWLYKAIRKHYPDSIQTLAQNMHQRAPLWLRINTVKTTIHDYQKLLEEAGIDYQVNGEQTVVVNQGGEVSILPGYQQGLFAVQDKAAQQAALLLAVQSGDIVLDCCAAPGGKTAAIMEHSPNLGHLYVLDSEAKRMARVHENLNRLGHDEFFKNKYSCLVSDATQLCEDKSLPQFDRILLDAPCSATGVIRRHPDIMWLRKSTDIARLVEIQSEILEQAWQKLKPKGMLVYATCSILPEENQQQIERFIATHKDAKLKPIAVKNELNAFEHKDLWQIMPGEQGMDGFFYARLEKQ